MTQKLILGLDIGSSSVRAALYDMRGEMVPETLVKNERSLETTDDGGSEIDAEIAVKQVIKTIDDVLRTPAARRADIAYVVSCAFWHSLVGVDVKGKPTTNVIGWADTRGGKYVGLLRKRFDEDEIHNRTGARFHSSFWPAKLLRLRNEHSDSFERTSVWLSFSDLVALRLFGIAATSVSMASGTGVFDIRTCNWDASIARYLGIASGSLPLVSIGSYTYRLIEKYRRRWPRLRSAEWFPAIADGAANNIGSGCVKQTRASLMIGTSGAMRVAFSGEPPENIPTGLWCYRVDRERVILGGALSDGGGLYRWLSKNLRLAGDAETLIAGREPDSHGLTFMPFLAGERSTGYNEEAAGVIAGLRSSNDSTDILHAALESVAYRFAEILDQLNSVGRVREIIASGGALHKSPVWAQIIADVLGPDLALMIAPEASMRGAVLLALESCGVTNVAQAEVGAVSIKCDKARHRVYQNARRRHGELYRRLFKT